MEKLHDSARNVLERAKVDAFVVAELAIAHVAVVL